MSIDISCWQQPPQTLLLAENEVHLWRFALSTSQSNIKHLKAILSPDEGRRTDRLLDAEKAEKCIVARARLRQILGKYLKHDPANLAFSYNDKGKPSLQTEHDSKLKFNLAHSGTWALLAITTKAEIGVDLEQIDLNVDYRKIVEQFFNAGEKAEIERFTRQRQRRGFYRVWTQKEAGLKKTGFGFSTDLTTVTCNREYFFRLFPISKNYLGAIAADSEPCTIRRFKFIEE